MVRGMETPAWSDVMDVHGEGFVIDNYNENDYRLQTEMRTIIVIDYKRK